MHKVSLFHLEYKSHDFGLCVCIETAEKSAFEASKPMHDQIMTQ